MARAPKTSRPSTRMQSEDMLGSLRQRQLEYEEYFSRLSEEAPGTIDNAALRAYLSLVKMICAMSAAGAGSEAGDAEAMRRVAGVVLEEVYGIKPGQ